MPRHFHRLSVVERFELSELVGVRFDQIREPAHHVLPVDGLHLGPFAAFESLAGCADGQIHVGGIAECAAGQDLIARRVANLEGFSAGRVHPGPSDQQLTGLLQESGGGLGDAGEIIGERGVGARCGSDIHSWAPWKNMGPSIAGGLPLRYNS